MGLPAGIDFRADNSSAGFINIDPANCDYEIGSTANYGSHTTAQGLSVGWLTAPDITRNRNSANDGRLAGFHGRTNTNGTEDYRIDLPATGTYSINFAAGDPSYARVCKVEFFDNTTSLGVICNGSTGAANRFFDASGTIRTHAAWVSSNTAGSFTFASTIFKIRIGGAASDTTALTHVFITSSGGGSTYSVSLSEAATATDSVSSAAIFPSSVSESGTATDAVSAVPIYAASVSESATATDSTSSLAVFASSITEAGTATDTVSSLGAFVASVSESATAIDFITATGGTGTAAQNILNNPFFDHIGRLMGR